MESPSESFSRISPGKKLSPADLALFAEMLAGLVRAKLPLPQALKLLAHDAESARVRGAIGVLERDVSAGIPLSEALRSRGAQFPDLFTRLIEHGAASNDLHGALVELVREYRSQTRFREALWSQLLGPLATCVVFAIVLFALFIWNVPVVFQNIFESYLYLGGKLPLPTRMLFSLYRSVYSPSALVYGTLTLIFCVNGIFWLRGNKSGMRWLQTMILRLPVVGPFIRSRLLGRFCRLTGLLLLRGIPLDSALILVRDSFAFHPMHDALARIERKVFAGSTLPDAMSNESIFPGTLKQFVSGAHVHGDLPDALSQLAELYEQRGEIIGNEVRMLIYMSAMLLIGACVAWMVLAFFMPLFSYSGHLMHK